MTFAEGCAIFQLSTSELSLGHSIINGETWMAIFHSNILAMGRHHRIADLQWYLLIHCTFSSWFLSNAVRSEMAQVFWLKFADRWQLKTHLFSYEHLWGTLSIRRYSNGLIHQPTDRPVLSCTIYEIRRLIGWKLRIFLLPHSHLTASFGVNPFEFLDELLNQKSKVLGLSVVKTSWS